MDRRDYFATNAPAVPDWFEHEPPGAPPAEPDFKALCQLHPQEHDESRSAYVERLRRPFVKARNLWRLAGEQARYFQWRRFYADEMLKLLGGDP